MKVTVGVSGGVAAFKAAELVRALQRQALDVHVVMTASATRFITPLTFAALTGHRVITGLWPEQDPAESGVGPSPEMAPGMGPEAAIEHIAEAQSTSALIVAPATAHTLARFAHGLADDFLTTMYLATTAPVVLAPAMNVVMWQHPATQANLEILTRRGARIVPPEDGYLACGMTGSGRLAQPEAIVEATLQALQSQVLIQQPPQQQAPPPPSGDLAGEVLLITAGGTREAIDPVRFIGNRSSGKMGYALAEAAQRRGARVILISGPTFLPPPAQVELVSITTAEQMRRAALSLLDQATIVIKTAAVADYRPRIQADHKMKRSGPITLELEPTEDILRQLVLARKPGTLIIGFAAETEDPLAHARDKLLRKGADAIVLNDVSRAGIGFDSDRNAVSFLTPQRAIELPEMTKRELAHRILDEVLALRKPAAVLAETGIVED